MRPFVLPGDAGGNELSSTDKHSSYLPAAPFRGGFQRQTESERKADMRQLGRKEIQSKLGLVWFGFLGTFPPAELEPNSVSA